MNKFLLVLAATLLFSPGVATAGHPINNLVDIAVPVKGDGAQFWPDEVQSIIIEATSARGWSPVLEAPGVITATINVRGKHFAKVEIPFSATNYSILYVSSDNLDYNARRQTIHRNYNNWVVKLSGTINKNLREAIAATGPVPNTSTPGSTPHSSREDVYTQLLQLDELRDKGILTEEEFQAEKRKLLEQN
jgi:hypothetical protein